MIEQTALTLTSELVNISHMIEFDKQLAILYVFTYVLLVNVRLHCYYLNYHIPQMKLVNKIINTLSSSSSQTVYITLTELTIMFFTNITS